MIHVVLVWGSNKGITVRRSVELSEIAVDGKNTTVEEKQYPHAM
jgi:hypothetical protein